MKVKIMKISSALLVTLLSAAGLANAQDDRFVSCETIYGPKLKLVFQGPSTVHGVDLMFTYDGRMIEFGTYKSNIENRVGQTIREAVLAVEKGQAHKQVVLSMISHLYGDKLIVNFAVPGGKHFVVFQDQILELSCKAL